MKKNPTKKKPSIRNLVHKHAHKFNKCKVIDVDKTRYTRKNKKEDDKDES